MGLCRQGSPEVGGMLEGTESQWVGIEESLLLVTNQLAVMEMTNHRRMVQELY